MQLEKKHLQKIAVVLVIIAIIAGYKVFGLGDYLSLSFLKESREQFQAIYAEHTAAVIAIFMVIYIIVTAVSLPGAAVMTLASGALFGLIAGTIMVSFASSIGATLACAVARFLLRDWVQGKFQEKLKTVNRGIEREGAFYLFTLRLIPIFPFWMINLVMGVSRMKLFTFYWISQVGMLPGTIVYVNAGKQLGELESVSGIFSLEIILSFALLGIFPLAVKKIMKFVRARKGQPELVE
ncbi:MAG: TVP38/TMEM64 family protein [Desulfurivibrionaceae bacterium]